MRIRQLEPVKGMVPLEGLYLKHNLQALAGRNDRPIVVANYITDLDDVIAILGTRGSPEKLQNPSDWRLFQEVAAQADVLVAGAGYMSEFAEKGESGQNIITQFNKGSPFEDLGDWREQAGLERSPDLVIVSRRLNFSIAGALSESSKRIFVFTTHRMRNTEKAKKLELAGAVVFGAGANGVDGALMVERLGQEGYAVINMTAGPEVLELLLKAKFESQGVGVVRKGAVDRLYITRVNRRITAGSSKRITVLKSRRVDDLVAEEGGFRRIEKYVQDKVTTGDGFETSQEFLVYETKDMN